MTAAVFVASAEQLAASPVVLAGPEGRHAATVRRVSVGEHVDVVDGHGRRARCVVAAAGRDTVTLDVTEVVTEPQPLPRLVVVQALAKGDRGELAVEAMTEVGVDVVVPWAASRSVVQWRAERGARALERWRTTAREAGKQARRARFPDVRAAASTAQVAALLATAALGVVLDEGADEPLVSVPVPPSGDVVVVVGPEGGVAPDETAAFAAAGARPCRLGPTVLRTSTAGVAALAVLLARSGRWS